MLDRAAAVPHHAHARHFGVFRNGYVPEIELEPDGGDLGGERVVDNGAEELAAPEDIYEVDVLILRDVDETVVRALAVDQRRGGAADSPE